MPSDCKHCGENAVDNEEQVCKSCGIVYDDIHFGSEYNPFGMGAKAKLIPFRKNKNTAGLEYGLQFLEYLSDKYKLTSNLNEEVSELLKKVYAHTKSFAVIEDVGILAGCCLMHVLRKHRQFVSLTDICRKMNCSKKKAFKFKNILKNYCNGNIEEECVESTTMDMNPEGSMTDKEEIMEIVESSIQTLFSSFFHETKTEFIAKTIKLSKLAHSCWLVTGRSLETVIIASGFLCWKSMHPSRKGLTFSQFCSDFNLPITKARSRVSELKQMLLKLGRNVPSLTKNYVNEKNVLFHLNYILENSDTLRNDLLTEEFSVEEIDKKEFAAFRKIRTKNNLGSESKFDPNMRASDIEISDTEISSYIRTEEQVEMIKTLKERKGRLQP